LYLDSICRIFFREEEEVPKTDPDFFPPGNSSSLLIFVSAKQLTRVRI